MSDQVLLWLVRMALCGGFRVHLLLVSDFYL